MEVRKIHSPEESCNALYELNNRAMSKAEFQTRAKEITERGILPKSVVKAIERSKKFSASSRERERLRALALLSI